MSIGLISLILENYTPVFDWFGYLFYPVTLLFTDSGTTLGCKAAFLGLAEMYLPVLSGRRTGELVLSSVY